ncbi:MAG: efflux RND transporter periplasmic adaptor subunit [Clostridia bacterium]
MKREGEARSIWPRIRGYFLAAILLLTLLSRAADSMMLPVVKCARPLPGALSHKAILSGVIEAEEQWPVMTEPGIAVARVYVRAGQRVKAGETLLNYDAEAIQRKLDDKQFELKKLTWQAQLDALEQPASDDKDKGDGENVNREKQVLKQQIGRLEVGKIQREIERLSQIVYGGATLAAPVDGTVSEVLVKPGDTAQGAALRLSPASSGLIVRAAVTEDQMAHLKPGMEARFQRSGDARAGEGVTVLKGVSPAQAGYEASFKLPDGAGSVGQAVNITMAQNTDTYDMRVPLGAIVDQGGNKGVYRIRTGQSVLGDMEYADFVHVTVIETDAQYAAINASLEGKDQVIVSSSKPLSAGDRVRSSS